MYQKLWRLDVAKVFDKIPIPKYIITPCTLGKNTAYSDIEDTIKGKEVVMINLHYESFVFAQD